MQEMWEMQLESLGREDPLEKGMATHSSILAWRTPWTEEPGGLQSMGLQSQTRLSNLAPSRELPTILPLPPWSLESLAINYLYKNLYLTLCSWVETVLRQWMIFCICFFFSEVNLYEHALIQKDFQNILLGAKIKFRTVQVCAHSCTSIEETITVDSGYLREKLGKRRLIDVHFIVLSTIWIFETHVCIILKNKFEGMVRLWEF